MEVSTEFADELIGMIYAAMLGETSWQAFLSRLNDVTPDAFSTLFFHDAHRATGDVTLIAGGYETVLDDYAAYYSRINPWMQRVAGTPLGQGIIGEQIVERADFNRSEYYNDFIHRNGLETGLGVTLFRDEGCYFLLSILTGDKETDRNLKRAALLDRLAPHLQRVFRYYRSGPFQQSTLSFSRTLGEALNTTLIMVDDKLRVRTASPRGEDYLAEGTLIGLDPLGRVRLGDPAQHAMLCRMLDRRSDAERTMRFATREGDMQLVRVGMSTDIQYFAGPAVAIFITGKGDARRLSAEQVMSTAYALTPAEMRVLSGVLAGGRLKDIALRQGVGLETVRSQLKSIFAKTGVNSQADLVRVAAGTLRDDQ